MNSKNLQVLAAIIAGLIVVYFLTDDGGDTQSGGDEFIPGLKSNLNSTTALEVHSGKGTFTVSLADNQWVIAERDDYPADVGALRELLIAMADARIVETKTSNPEKYHLIGVNDPDDEDSEAVALSIRGDSFEHSVILGKSAQRNYRYARHAGDEQSVLIDKNPDVADEVGGWLVQDLLDIAASRIRAVTIEHADGERIEIVKESADSTNYEVVNIPDGRELSYATVANGIAGALAGLQLEDVRQAGESAEPMAVAVFRSFDGLSLSVASFGGDDESWIAVSAEADAVPPEDESAAADGDEASGEAAEMAEEADDEEAAGTDQSSVAAEAAEINDRLGGWQFRIPSYKANLLKRRFEDILKAQDADADGP